MPEGAEVKIISEGLAKRISGRSLVSIKAISGRYTRKPILGLHDATPSKIVGVGVKGKLIFWILNNDMYLLNTLGMTGTWSSALAKHSRVQFDFSEGKPIFYEDMRNFGTIKIIRGKKNFLAKINSLGPDMLNQDVSNQEFLQALEKRPYWCIAKAIMDQRVVCGVGNYVKAEALYRAGISPHRLVGSLSGSDLERLNSSIKLVLIQAYNRRGATIKTYKDVDGKPGSGMLTFMVYGKKNDPCGFDVIREKTADGRTTHWVPEVQK